MAQSRKSGSAQGKKPASPKRGILRALEVVRELKPVHTLSLRLPQDLFSRLKEAAGVVAAGLWDLDRCEPLRKRVDVGVREQRDGDGPRTASIRLG